MGSLTGIMHRSARRLIAGICLLLTLFVVAAPVAPYHLHTSSRGEAKQHGSDPVSELPSPPDSPRILCVIVHDCHASVSIAVPDEARALSLGAPESWRIDEGLRFASADLVQLLRPPNRLLLGAT